jgi:hypothetical protein
MRNNVQTRDASKENRAIYHISVDTVLFVDAIVPFYSKDAGVDQVGRRVEAYSLARGEDGNYAE